MILCYKVVLEEENISSKLEMAQTIDNHSLQEFCLRNILQDHNKAVQTMIE